MGDILSTPSMSVLPFRNTSDSLAGSPTAELQKPSNGPDQHRMKLRRQDSLRNQLAEIGFQSQPPPIRQKIIEILQGKSTEDISAELTKPAAQDGTVQLFLNGQRKPGDFGLDTPSLTKNQRRNRKDKLRRQRQRLRRQQAVLTSQAASTERNTTEDKPVASLKSGV